MDAQDQVAAFVTDHGLEAPPEYRLLDLVAELGEVSKNVAESTDYGADPHSIAIDRDELGDALFALLALAESLDVDAEVALQEAIDKYERRIEDRGEPSSGAGSPSGD